MTTVEPKAGAAVTPVPTERESSGPRWRRLVHDVAPVAGALSDRIGGGLLMGTGLTLQAIGLAWLGLISSTSVAYGSMVMPFIISGVGMGLFFAPMANVILSSVRSEEEGKASGASSAIRELGGVFGVAILAAIFAREGSFASPQAFVDGMTPAVLLGAGVVAIGAVAAFLIPSPARRDATAAEAVPTGTQRPAQVYVTVDD